jgi:hypothetical protein
MGTAQTMRNERVSDFIRTMANRLRFIAGYGLLMSCFFGSMRYLGVSLPPNADYIAVGVTMVLATYRVFTHPAIYDDSVS